MQFSTRLGTVTVVPVSDKTPEGKTVLCGAETMSYAPVTCPMRSPSFGLKFKVEEDKDGVAFVVRDDGEEPRAIGPEWQTLNVPVQWDDGTPKTRFRGLDNRNIVILRPDGWFVNVEVSLFTRRGKFFLGAQRVYEGQVARTRGEKNRVVIKLLPRRAIHAYPGSDFTQVWSTFAETLMAKAKAEKASVQKCKAFDPTWRPPAFPKPNGGGWIAGVVRYFNLLTGTGELEGPDGMRYFVHFKSLLPAEGSMEVPEVPTLTPMTIALFRPGEDTGHARPGIKSVKSVRPFLPKEPAD
jgi:hypothetical protein